MGIVDRIGRVVRANLNTLLDGTEDPDKVIAQTLREMEAGIRTARQDLVRTLGTGKRLDEEAATHQAEVDRWQERARLALRAGDEDLARQALAQKLAEAKVVADKQASAAQHRGAAAELERAIETLEARRQELDANKGVLAGQVRAARAGGAPPGAAKATAKVGELDRMTSRIDAMEAEIEASGVLSDPKKAELEARFAALEANQQDGAVEDQLAALKRRLDEG
ncbi:MAG: PspA/IM30 family protein [Myxococcales bacterium]|nr:PspA/IM30 family protein [Myxococcales bacterium]